MVINDLMEVDTIDEVIYIKKDVNPSEVRKTMRSCEELGVVFRLKYRDIQLNLTNAFTSVIGNEKFLTFINVPYKPAALASKKFMDITFSDYSIAYSVSTDADYIIIGKADLKRTYYLPAGKSRITWPAIRLI